MFVIVMSGVARSSLWQLNALIAPVHRAHIVLSFKSVIKFVTGIHPTHGRALNFKTVSGVACDWTESPGVLVELRPSLSLRHFPRESV